MRLFMTLSAFTDNTFKAVPRHIVGDDACVVSVVDAGATFRGRSFETPVAVVWTFRDGRVVDVREHVYDVEGLDALWAGERPEGW
jgi:ketosteroid isomerase-like protein